MYLTVLKAKLHRARVTQVLPDYEGSCAIDAALLARAGIREFEQVHVYNVTNGRRLVTYAIVAPEGSGTVSLNGSAARAAVVGDVVIVAAYAIVTEEEAERHRPRLVYLDAENRIVRHHGPDRGEL
jgi:aspartate 1-decarboxylase